MRSIFQASLPQLYQHVLMWGAVVMAVLMMGTMFAMYGGQHCNLLFVSNVCNTEIETRARNLDLHCGVRMNTTFSK